MSNTIKTACYKKFFTGKVKKWAKKVQINSFSEANYRTSAKTPKGQVTRGSVKFIVSAR